MTYKQLQDEVIALRLRDTPALRASTKFAINQRYQDVWAAASWSFKTVNPANLALAVADDTPALPTDLLKPLFIWNDDGIQLDYLEPYVFWDMFEGDASTASQPDRWTWADGIVTLGAIPSAVKTYRLAYLRRLVSKLTGGGLQVGKMVADTDQPFWSETEYDHTFLVDGALSLIKRRLSDPTWELDETSFQASLQGMIAELLMPQPVHSQYGADPLD